MRRRYVGNVQDCCKTVDVTARLCVDRAGRNDIVDRPVVYRGEGRRVIRVGHAMTLPSVLTGEQLPSIRQFL
jgi:hypothetical protein